ncbi:MAG: D-2-hydroxyacid dehydrogenase [Chloroflexota bacterium]
MGKEDMQPVTVVVTTDVGRECLERIATVADGLVVYDASRLVAKEREAGHRDEMLDRLLGQAEIIYGLRLPRDVIRRAPALRWIQLMSTGVDAELTDEICGSQVIVTNASGFHESCIGEHVVMVMLMFVKQALRCVRQKEERKWEWFLVSQLRGKTVGIVGLGRVGREIARLANAFGMQVLATRRSARKQGRARNVDLVLPMSRLNELLGRSDFVVLSVPLTAETEGLIGEPELQAMKKSAYLVNVARGNIVNEDALVGALEEGTIAGAGLDVFATEPLPVDSPLWQLPNVIFSPHNAGDAEGYNDNATAQFCQNLERYLGGRELMSRVDKRKGY